MRRYFFGILSLSIAALACGRIDTEVGAQRVVDAGDAAPPLLPSFVYFEAESGDLTGFTIVNDPAVSNGQYILPPDIESRDAPGQAIGRYTFSLAAGTYLLWARIHSPGASNNAYWISIDDEPPYLWFLSTGVIWYWGQVTYGTDYGHPVNYVFADGPHHLTIYNALPRVGLDRFYLGPPGNDPPGNTTPCNPPHSIELADGGCEPSCGSHGNTTCGSAACAGQTALFAYDCDVCCHVPLDAGAE